MSGRLGITPATGLRISERFSLPLEAVPETFPILARRGSGKTSTAVVMTEELVRACQQVVVLDPLGVWFGLRASVDGVARGGLPVVIIGGEDGDLPLPESRGSGTFSTCLSTLRRNGTVRETAEGLFAQDVLFMDPATPRSSPEPR